MGYVYLFCQLSQMNPCDGIVLQTGVDEQCNNKLAVDGRRYCQLSRPTTSQVITSRASEIEKPDFMNFKHFKYNS